MKNDLRRPLISSVILHTLPFILLALLSLLGGGGNSDKNKDGKGQAKEEKFDVDIIPPKGEEEFVAEESEFDKLKKKSPHVGDDCDNFYGGVGIVQSYGPNGYVIQEVYEGYPAARAGLQPGDELLPTEEIRGEVGTPVVLKIKRHGQIIVFDLIRDKICTSEKKNKGANP